MSPIRRKKSLKVFNMYETILKTMTWQLKSMFEFTVSWIIINTQITGVIQTSLSTFMMHFKYSIKIRRKHSFGDTLNCGIHEHVLNSNYRHQISCELIKISSFRRHTHTINHYRSTLWKSFKWKWSFIIRKLRPKQ